MRGRILGSILLLGGCFEDSAGGDDELGPTAGPRSGLWLYTEGDAVDDTCMWADRPAVASGEFDVTNGEDGTFTILPRAQGQRTDCVMTLADFECDPVAATVDAALLDAQIDTISVTRGTLETREHVDGSYQMAVDCTGTQCDVAATAAGVAAFPCSYAVSFSAVFVE